MEYELVNWLANLLNFLIIIFLIIKTIHSPCFNLLDTSVSLGGLGVSIVTQLVVILIKRSKDEL